MTQLPDVATLSRQQALFTEGLRRVALGRYNGAAGLAAVIDALDPDNAGKWGPPQPDFSAASGE